MVNPQALQFAVIQQSQYQLVRVFKHLGRLHANPSQFVDIEEAAIIDVICRNAKMSRTPVLQMNQGIQLLPASHIARLASESFDGSFQCGTYLAVSSDSIRELSFQFSGSLLSLRPKRFQSAEFFCKFV